MIKLRSNLNSLWEKWQLFLVFPQFINYASRYTKVSSQIESDYRDYVTNVSTPGMAISLETAVFLRIFCDLVNPTSILDLGSGFSSFILRSYAHYKPGVKVVSVDDNIHWLQKTHEYLATKKLKADNLFYWEAFREQEGNQFDFVFHDLGNMTTREEALQTVVALTKLANGSFVLLDDMHKNYYHTVANNVMENNLYRPLNIKPYTQDDLGRFAILYQK
jgi:predicted O-methyltransferase YrrM